MTRAEFIAIVEATLQDYEPRIGTYDPGARGLSSADYISETIDSNVGELSDYVPQKFVEDIPGTDTRYYALDALTEWPAAPDDDNAEVAKIWFPWPTTDEENTNRDNYEYDVAGWTVDHWLISETQKKALIFRGGDVPGASETIRVLYYVDQDMTNTPITLPAKHIEAFASLVAGKYILGGLASGALQSVRNTPVADAVNLDSPLTTQAAGEKLIDMFYYHFGEIPAHLVGRRNGTENIGGKKLRQWNKATDKTSRHWLGAR